MSINLHLLRIFFNVAQERSFSKAAERLYISQPAVSKAVRELEEQLGLPLVERGILGPKNSRRVILTDSGSSLYGHAYAIFELECSGLMKPDTHLGENARQIEVSDDQTTPYLFP
ncbi:LysR family transcriptional regulator [Pseudomonas sp. EA_65y_Pfl1_P120]|uniref:LysR family transcriptional regulator n=1 Tax=Pseudomonas sp. EA_65y_Pfl1_P120 TaxID=3088693 RepID=UPI0030D81ABA